jgi:hypothetical protein
MAPPEFGAKGAGETGWAGLKSMDMIPIASIANIARPHRTAAVPEVQA